MNTTLEISFNKEINDYFSGTSSVLNKLLTQDLDTSDILDTDFDIFAFFKHPVLEICSFFDLVKILRTPLKEKLSEKIDNVIKNKNVNENENENIQSIVFQICTYSYLKNLEILKSIFKAEKVLRTNINSIINTPLEKYGGMTCLHFAVLKEDNLEVIKFLLAYGAKFTSLNYRAQNPLHIMFMQKNYIYLKYIISHGNIGHNNFVQKDIDGQNIFNIILNDEESIDHKEIIKLLSNIFDFDELKKELSASNKFYVTILECENSVMKNKLNRLEGKNKSAPNFDIVDIVKFGRYKNNLEICYPANILSSLKYCSP